jgi:hypothetical protein
VLFKEAKMMKSLCGILTVVLLTGYGIAGQSKAGTIEGVWRVVEVTIPGPDPRTIAFSGRPNLTIITPRHYSRVEVQADGPRPVLADVTKATADELRAAWGPFVAEAGTYEVTGDYITMRPIASKNPAVMGPGVFITYAYTLNGDALSVTQQRNEKAPFANPVTFKLVRVE